MKLEEEVYKNLKIMIWKKNLNEVEEEIELNHAETEQTDATLLSLNLRKISTLNYSKSMKKVSMKMIHRIWKWNLDEEEEEKTEINHIKIEICY